jgi:hypothetical protein
MGRTDGYIAADYLLQHGRRIRRTACPPLSLWESCLTQLADASDLLAIGDGARDRCLLNLAERFYRAADSAPEAAEMLSELMSEQGRYTEAEQILRAALSRENPDAAVRLGYLVRRLDRAEEAESLLRALAAGKHGARRALAILPERQERFEEAERVLPKGCPAAGCRTGPGRRPGAGTPDRLSVPSRTSDPARHGCSLPANQQVSRLRAVSSSRREFHPPALADPYVTVSVIRLLPF